MNDIIKIDSISKLHQLMGFPKPNHPLISVVDFSKIDLSELEKRESYKTAFDFYSISLKGENECSIKYGREYYDFEEGVLLFSAPGQIINYEEIDEEAKYSGWGIFFHPDLIRGTFLNSKIKEYNFFHYSVYEALHISQNEKDMLESILTKVKKEYENNIDQFSQEVLVSHLGLILSYSQRFYGRQFITRKKQNIEIIHKLQNILTTYYKEGIQLKSGIPTVKFLSEKLNITSNYLTDLLKQETGKNTQEHIHLYLIEKAKDMLVASNKSASEIAYELGFEYSQYFSRLFKAKTGMTPNEFRSVS